MLLTFFFPFLFFFFQPFGTPTDDLQALRDLNARFIHHFVTNDTAAHSRILHPQFLYINARGQTVNRQQYLLDWAHGFDGYRYWDYRAERIRLFGHTALVSAVNWYVCLVNGKETTGASVYTDVYVKEDGVWTCVQAQITDLDPAFLPGEETVIRAYDLRR